MVCASPNLSVLPKNRSKIIAAIPIGKCLFTILLSNFNGLIKVVIPITNKKLHIQLPIALPIIKSECPFIADVIVINTSGSDVPSATIVKPISISDRPNLLAILVAALTNKSAPLINKTNPIITNIISNNKILAPSTFYCMFM